MFSSVSAVDAVNFTFFSVIFIVTGLRLVCRSYVSWSFGLDDGFVAIAVILGLAYVILVHFEYSIFQSLWTLVKAGPESKTFTSDDQQKKFSEALRLIIAENECQLGATTFAKLSLIAFYRQLTRALRSHVIILHCLDAVLIINFFTLALIYIFGSEPIGCLFNYYKYKEDCECRVSMTYVLCASGGVQIFVDICLLVLPWVVLRNLQISVSDKVRLTLMYGVGFITLAFSAARIHAVLNDNLSTRGWLLSQFNFVTWGTIEAFTAIICVNIPCLVAGFKKWHNRRMISNGNHDHNHALEDSHHHRSLLTSRKASHLYKLQSVSSIHTNAFYDATSERETSENTRGIKITQEVRTDVETSRHYSNEDTPSSVETIV